MILRTMCLKRKSLIVARVDGPVDTKFCLFVYIFRNTEETKSNGQT